MFNNFDKCLVIVLNHEGGYVNHPRDPGGMTNLGVTKRVYEKWIGRSVTEREMRRLTKNDVEPIYEYRYWRKVLGDELPAGLDLVVFDFGVNAGWRRSARTLQAMVGAKTDGYIGPATLKAIKEYNRTHSIGCMIEEFGAMRLDYYKSLKHWDVFGRGWARRVETCEAHALAMSSD